MTTPSTPESVECSTQYSNIPVSVPVNRNTARSECSDVPPLRGGEQIGTLKRASRMKRRNTEPEHSIVGSSTKHGS